LIGHYTGKENSQFSLRNGSLVSHSIRGGRFHPLGADSLYPCFVNGKPFGARIQKLAVNEVGDWQDICTISNENYSQRAAIDFVYL
jgi:hypothetical protein